MEPLNTPNLDCLSDEELREYSDTYQLLGLYALKKRRAQMRRAQGSIAQAMVYEQDCERLYAQLPDWAKW